MRKDITIEKMMLGGEKLIIVKIARKTLRYIEKNTENFEWYEPRFLDIGNEVHIKLQSIFFIK